MSGDVSVPTAGPGPGPGQPKAPILSSEAIAKLKAQISAQLAANANKVDALPECLLDYQLPGLADGMDTVNSLLSMAHEHQAAPKWIGLEGKVGEIHRRVVPSRVPLGVSLDQLAMERERLLKSRIDDRITKLSDELSSTMIIDESADGAFEEHTQKKIELKMLQLRDRQRQLREQVLRVAQQNMALDLAAERAGSAYRRPKKQSIRELRQLEKLERQQRLDRTRKERATYFDYLNAVMGQAREFDTVRRNNHHRRVKLQKQIMNHHSAYEKEEQRRAERLAKDRLRALKADDEEGYLRLLDQQKDTRLTHLLKQTDEFLLDLSSKVVAQQNDARMDVEIAAEADAAVVEAAQTGDYYGTAHRIREAVTEQSSLLEGGRLKEYQLRGLEWMLSLYNNHLNGILADEMGLGKTIQTISLITYLMEHKGQTGPYLIIVPLSTMTNWSLEFQKWAPQVARVEYKGVPATRKALQAQMRHSKFNVLLTTYEYIIKDRPFLSKIKWLHMIIDEGHRMKNAGSKLTQTLTQYYTSRFRLILTGTPLQNNLPELWALLNFVLPHIFNSCRTFEEWFNAPFANTGEKVELNEEETLLIIRRLHKVLRPFLLRRLKKDVESELPDKVELVLRCPMSALQLQLYRMVKNRGAGQASAGIKRLNNTIMQLRKICNHPFVFEEVERQVNPAGGNNDLLHRAAGKLDLLNRILPKLQASGHRVLIFFQMTQVMTIMEDFLNMIGLKYLRLDGSTKAEDRSELLARFNDPQSPYFCFLLSTRAGGLGLNLQTADTVIIFDSDWNPHQDLQAQDRAHRIGQTKEVRILRLVTVDSVEEYILERAQFKLNLDGKVIQAGKFDQKSTNEEREALLRAILEGEQERAKEDDVYDDEELNEMIARSDDERALFQRIDAELARKANGKPRLLEDSELPSVYLEADEEDAGTVSATPEPGTGVRAARRKDISYNENMSDDRWLATLERDPSKAVAIDTTFSGDIGPMSAESLATADVPDTLRAGKKRKVGRQQSQPQVKLTLGAPATEAEGEEKIRPDGLDESTRSRIVNQLLDAVDDAVDESGHRYRADIFQELPPRSLYPDYYTLIRRPIALEQIRARTYPSVWALLSAFELMFSNAQAYNIEGSQVYEDAAVLRQLVRDRLDELLESVGRFDGDNAGSSDMDEDEDQQQQDEDDEVIFQDDDE